MSVEPSYLILSVGGFQYKVKRELLLQFPDCFFDRMLNSEWKESSEAIVEIQRDGELFHYVYEYMLYGKLPRDESGISFLGDASKLEEILHEADFYQLPGLVAECQRLIESDGLIHACAAERSVQAYVNVKDKIDAAISTLGGKRKDWKVVYDETGSSSLLALLRSNPFAPAWVTGKLGKACNTKIFMSTTVKNVNVEELVAAAQPSPFGRGPETVLDQKVRDSLDIPATELGNLNQIIKSINMSKLAPNMKLTLKPYKLVIYQEGGHFDNHRDTVRDECQVGTLVVILNSTYQGGELEVCHGQQSVVVTGALQWVAMFGDCMHTIRPVTSGTRVSLIFDILNESDKLKSNTRSYRFWPGYGINREFWRKKGTTEKSLVAASKPTVAIVKVWNQIYAALDKELEEHTTVSICLEHLYPACQANPDFLKGEDAELYDMLKVKYSVGVTAVTLARSIMDDEDDYNQQVESLGYIEFGSDHLIAEKNVLFVPNAMQQNSLLHYSQIDYTGNQAAGDERVYLVAALVVRKQT